MDLHFFSTGFGIFADYRSFTHGKGFIMDLLNVFFVGLIWGIVIGFFLFRTI